MPPRQTFQNKGLGKEVAPNQSCNPRMLPGQSVSKERMVSLHDCQVRGASLSVQRTCSVSSVAGIGDPEDLVCDKHV